MEKLLNQIRLLGRKYSLAKYFLEAMSELDFLVLAKVRKSILFFHFRVYRLVLSSFDCRMFLEVHGNFL